jgi:FKBP-type peptidyl-prolyl cis-trans isomerase
LKLMHVGDHIIVYIPTNLAYGAQGSSPSVPPNSVIIFDLTLVSIGPPIQH